MLLRMIFIIPCISSAALFWAKLRSRKPLTNEGSGPAQLVPSFCQLSANQPTANWFLGPLKPSLLRSLFVIPLSWFPPLEIQSPGTSIGPASVPCQQWPQWASKNSTNMQSLSPGALGARLSLPMPLLLLLFEYCKITLFPPSWKRTPFPNISRALKFRLIFHSGPLVTRESVWHGNVRRHLSHIFVLSEPVERRASCLWDLPCKAFWHLLITTTRVYEPPLHCY
ncbi:hypothetical protein BJX64DRAFT_4833 [Aspergillus heterothallicus]